jgi:hypothetical protein
VLKRALAAEEEVRIIKAAYISLKAQLKESDARCRQREQTANVQINTLQAAKDQAETRAALAELRAEELEAKFRALKSALLETA